MKSDGIRSDTKKEDEDEEHESMRKGLEYEPCVTGADEVL